MWLAEAPAATVANMKYNDRLGFDSEQNAVLMRLVAV